ncbi:MAG: HAD hydrolase-like protein, partial [Candidatus Glassbacteria bacterium]|nr:HAD hydrolase-like protein [Candidatus Glassbacteria bacterium]
LDSFVLVAKKFGFRLALAGEPEDAGGALWLRDRYLAGIEQVHRRKKAAGFPSPEVRIEEIWSGIISELETLGYNSAGRRRSLLPWTVALYYEIAFQQAVLYRGAAEALLRLKEMGIRQGIVSNAQFYTPVLLKIFLGEATGGRAGLQDIFEESLTSFSYRVGRAKPDPLIFSGVLSELDRLGVAREEAVYVGNDMLNDIRTAGSLGLSTVLFAGDGDSLLLHDDGRSSPDLRTDAVATAHHQIPFMLSGRAATGGRTLHLGVWHHHLRPGGVSTVIRDSLEALGDHGGYSEVRAEVFTDTSERGAEALDPLVQPGRGGPLFVSVFSVPGLGYDDSPAADLSEFRARAAGQRDLLTGLIDFTGCDKDNPYVLYAHNSALGKNPYASGGLRLLAEWAHRSGLPLLIISQTHDFAECHRPDRARAWRSAAPGASGQELAEWEFPAAPNVIHAVLTSADRLRLVSTGISPARAFVLANSVRECPAGKRKACSGLEKLLGGRPYLLMAQKVMRRKNTLEALVLLAALRRAGADPALVATLSAASPADRRYEDLVIKAAAAAGLPAVIGLQRTLGPQAPQFGEVVAGCSAFLTTSVMEGFGQSFLEGWVAGRPVLGRRLEDPCRDFEAAGVSLAHLYRHLLVEARWLPGGLGTLREAYREALEDLRRSLGFPPLQRKAFEEEFARCKTFQGSGGPLVDFADLSASMQAGMLGLIAADSRAGAQVLELNPWIESTATVFSGCPDELVGHNREAVLRSYGPRAKARRLRSLILAGTAAQEQAESPAGPRSLEGLLAETVSLEKTRLLFLDR